MDYSGETNLPRCQQPVRLQLAYTGPLDARPLPPAPANRTLYLMVGYHSQSFYHFLFEVCDASNKASARALEGVVYILFWR